MIEQNYVDSTYELRKILHTPADIQELAGKTYSVTNTYGGSHGRLFITPVFPLSASVVKLGGPGSEWIYADGSSAGGSLPDSCRNLAGYYTLQVRTPEPNLITLFQPGDSNTLITYAKTTAINTNNMSGVEVDGKVVLFAQSPSVPITSTGYSLTTNLASKHIALSKQNVRFDIQIFSG